MYINPHKIASNYPSPKVHSFTGKERDAETGFSYFGARYYDSDLSGLFLSVDPMADKYPGLSPYAYCAWNPVKLVDPNGDTLKLIGTEECKQKALQQMQSMSKNLTFSYDENGNVSCKGDATTKKEEYMKEILENNSITVLLEVQNNSYNKKGILKDGGGFFGNKLNDSKDAVTTFQAINVNVSEKYDKRCKRPGNMIWHEIAESFEGGKISLGSGLNAVAYKYGSNNTVYLSAHRKAGRYFPGDIIHEEVFKINYYPVNCFNQFLKPGTYCNYWYE